MALTASAIITRAQKTLLDATGDTWPESELIDYLNAALSFLVMHKPDATATTTDLVLTANTPLQSIPADGLQLLEVVRNTGGRAIRQADKRVMDNNNPDWYTETGTTIKHFWFDERNPTKFYVYPIPPTTPAVSVEITYTKTPTRITTTGDTLPVSDVYEVPLHFLTVAFAYMKNTKRGDINKSTFYLANAANILNIKMQNQFNFSPKEDDGL